MTSITFHGGVNDIGGNKFLVESNGTKIFMDFGMSFSEEGKFFSEFLNARTSNSLIDMFELGILPKIPGLYRRDYARHMGFGGNEETEIDAVLLTHAHVDHCAYIPYLREDIPIYCSEASYLIMQNFDETGSDQYLTAKHRFQIYQNNKGTISRASGDKVAVPRDVRIFESGKKFNIDSIEVNPLPVDHSIPGVHAFILDTPDGRIGNTADLRLHGRRKADTESFIAKCAESDLDVLLCEGTRIDKPPSITEYDVEDTVVDIVNNTKQLAICGYPVRDLDRLLSFHIAAVKSNRDLVIDMKQAYLLKLFNESDSLRGQYPGPTDKNIKIYIQRGKWGLIDKDLSIFTEKLLEEDYGTWQRDFIDKTIYPNSVDYRDIQKNQNQYLFYCSDFRLQDLIDIQPSEGSSYIRSLTEPFNDEMKIKEKQVKNWFSHFGVIEKEADWHSVHVSGHGGGEQIKYVIENTKSKSLIPIHTQHEEYHKKWHPNVTSINQHGMYKLK